MCDDDMSFPYLLLQVSMGLDDGVDRTYAPHNDGAVARRALVIGF